MKSNSSPEILKLLKDQNAFIDTVSLGETLLTLELGFTPDRILYTANNITSEEMNAVFGLGVLFNIDSLSRLEKFGQAHRGSEVCLRFNPNVVAGAHKNIRTGGKDTKFGLTIDSLNNALDIIRTYDLHVIGLHEHTGSGISNIEKFLQSVTKLLEIAENGSFPDLQFINFGGGFGVPNKPDEEILDYKLLGKKLAELFSSFCKRYGKELDLYLEPGRYIIAESGYLLMEVNTIKENYGKTFVGTDSGFPQLIRPMFYDAYHHIVNLSNPDGVNKSYYICGNICESGDYFAKNRDISEIRETDVLAILNAGAYCYSMGGIYNMRPMPAEVLVYNNSNRLIRERKSPQDLVNSIIKECS